jgi:oxygen-dependent protoporphyrinogen oxidase
MDLTSRSAQVGVIGGGIAGLTAAWLLSKKGYDVVVFEKEGQAGGNVRSSSSGGYILERGPYAFLRSSRWVWRMLKEARLEEHLVGATSLAGRRFVFKEGKLHAVPLGPVSFMTSGFFTCRAKLRLLAEPFVKGGAKERETAWEYFERRFGEEFATYVASAFVSGVYAGDIRRLGARAAFSKFWYFEKEHGSMIRGAIHYMRQARKQDRREGLRPRKGMWSFKGGLGFITRWLAGQLGGRVLTSFEVRSIEKSGDGIVVKNGGGRFACGKVVLAAPPAAGSEILREAYPEAAGILGSMPMVPVAVVQWCPSAGEADPFPRGFGFLVPPLYGMTSLGTIFYSKIFPQLSGEGKPGLYGTFVGGAHNPGAVDLDDERILRTVRAEHGILLGREVAEPSFVNIVRHPKAIAQLLPDHPEKVARARELLGDDGRVFLAGGYLTGVGIDQAVESAYRAAREVMGES